MKVIMFLIFYNNKLLNYVRVVCINIKYLQVILWEPAFVFVSVGGVPGKQ
jgi:hypothetical protein